MKKSKAKFNIMISTTGMILHADNNSKNHFNFNIEKNDYNF